MVKLSDLPEIVKWIESQANFDSHGISKTVNRKKFNRDLIICQRRWHNGLGTNTCLTNCEVQCNVKRWKLKDLSKGWKSKDKVEICWVWSRVDTNRWSFSRIKYSRRRSEVWWCDSSDSILTLNKQRARCETRVNKLLPLICQQGYVQLVYLFRTHLWVIWISLKIWYSISCTNTIFYHLENFAFPPTF